MPNMVRGSNQLGFKRRMVRPCIKHQDWLLQRFCVLRQ